MKRTLIILAAALLLAGCGHPKDPFVGTWQAGPYKLLIAKVQNVYVVDSLVGGRQSGDGKMWLSRHGDRLTQQSKVVDATTGKPTGEVLKWSIQLDQTGHLQWHSPEVGSRTYSRVSSSPPAYMP